MRVGWSRAESRAMRSRRRCRRCGCAARRLRPAPSPTRPRLTTSRSPGHPRSPAMTAVPQGARRQKSPRLRMNRRPRARRDLARRETHRDGSYRLRRLTLRDGFAISFPQRRPNQLLAACIPCIPGALTCANVGYIRDTPPLFQLGGCEAAGTEGPSLGRERAAVDN